MIRLPKVGSSLISLWLVDLDAPSTENETELVALDALSCSERARASRFHHANDARWYVASHNALRLLLAAETDIHPKELCFVESVQGKPCLDSNTLPQFNMSHANGWALIGISSDASIGVDIELLRPINDLTALAERSLSINEMDYLTKLPPSEQSTAFLRCWTRKESCLKALGSGLSIEPGTFEAGMEAELRELSLATDHNISSLSVISIGLPIDAVAAVAWLMPASQPKRRRT